MMNNMFSRTFLIIGTYAKRKTYLCILPLLCVFTNNLPVKTHGKGGFAKVLIMMLCVSLSSCKKDEGDLHKHREVGPVEGVVEYFGSAAADGCGWLIEIDSISYSPVNLPEEFQKKEGQKVLVTYELLGEKFICGFPTPQAPRYDKLKIKEIKLKK